MPCEATSAPGSWNATPKLFAAHATTTTTTTGDIRNAALYMCVCCFSFAAPVLCNWRRSWRGWRYQISACLSVPPARQRVIPGRGNRTASSPAAFRCLETDVSVPSWNGRKKGPARWMWNTAAPESMYRLYWMTVTALLRPPVSMLTGCSADASRCRRKLGKRWPNEIIQYVWRYQLCFDKYI